MVHHLRVATQMVVPLLLATVTLFMAELETVLGFPAHYGGHGFGIYGHGGFDDAGYQDHYEFAHRLRQYLANYFHGHFHLPHEHQHHHHHFRFYMF